MKEKGFTLIELLAVIVILAIIAVIATPMVLNTIEDARKGAAKSSATTYMGAVETSLAKYMLNNNGNKYSTGKHTVADLATDLGVEVKGDAPTEGYLCIGSNGTVENASVLINGYVVNYDGKETTTTDLDTVENIECGESYVVGDAVTIDGVGYHVIKKSSSSDEYVTLLRDESIGEFVFDENGGTDFETSTLKAYLDSTYKETFGDKQEYLQEITLLELGEYEDTYVESTDRYITLLKDNTEGSMIYLYNNYKDVFFSQEFTLTKDLAYYITSFTTGDITGGQISFVAADGYRKWGTAGMGGTATLDSPVLTPVRPVIVISKNAID